MSARTDSRIATMLKMAIGFSLVVLVVFVAALLWREGTEETMKTSAEMVVEEVQLAPVEAAQPGETEVATFALG